MRYMVMLAKSTKFYSDISDAANAALDDPDGGRLMIYDGYKQEWLKGEIILLAAITNQEFAR